tara:strand:+ start:1042 stop:1344 length:303 start_codon:yes stop_codon:yes gene_type:complete
MSWKDVLKAKRKWEKPTLGERTLVLGEKIASKYFNFAQKLYRKMATSKLLPNKVKMMATANDILIDEFRKWANKNLLEPKQIELKRLINETANLVKEKEK